MTSCYANVIMLHNIITLHYAVLLELHYADIIMLWFIM